MNNDITKILSDWSYKPDELQVRKIIGDDGKNKIQLRIDLGLLHMEIDNRPDGKSPHGYKTYLDYYHTLLKKHQTNSAETEIFKLSINDCLNLRHEAIQFYHRYISLFQLEEFDLVIRDTSHNLAILDLIENYATDEEIKWSFLQYSPYITMMNTRAKASIELTHKSHSQAVQKIDDGIKKIQNFFNLHGKQELIEHCTEINFLENWKQDIIGKSPLARKEKLEKALEEAIINENYENAAQIRDQINKL